MSLLDAALAALPILTVLALMILARRSAVLSGAAGLAVALVLAVTYFGPVGTPAPSTAQMLIGAGAEALFTASTILWIIFGALCIFHLQQKTGAIEHLRSALAGLSADPRIVAMLVAWFFALFAEGAAGFGTAVALTAPFLVSFGFAASDAVVVTMLGHGIGVSFGAVGIPTLAQAELVPASPAALGASAAVFHLLVGGVMLAALVRVVARGCPDDDTSGPRVRHRLGRWALLAGVCYLAPMYLIARYIGPELPTLGGSLAGGLLFVGIYRLVVGGAEVEQDARDERLGLADLSRAISPYLVVVALVLVTRVIGPVARLLESLRWSWRLWGEFEGGVEIVSHPGTLLVVGFLVGALLQGADRAQVRASVSDALRQLLPVALALGAMLGLSRLMAHAGMIDVLAAFAARTAGGAWPFVAAWVGALGTFVTGSATTSNILFSEFQFATATRLSLPSLTVLGAQNVGAAVGSIIAPSKIIAGGATVSIAGQEGEVLRRTLGPCALYIFCCGLLALVQVYWL